MKCNIILFIILLPAFTMGQTKPPADSLAKIVLHDLVDSWTLGIDSNTDAVNINIYNKFKSLFNLNAMVEDNLNVYYQYENKKSGSYKTGDGLKTFDVYAHDVALQVKSISVHDVDTLSSNTTDLANMIFTIKMSVDFQKTGKYVLKDNYVTDVMRSRVINKKDSAKIADTLNSKISKNMDLIYRFSAIQTLRVIMAYERDSGVKIKSIQSIKNEINCNNDRDRDAVLDQEDLGAGFGDFTANGRYDEDLDGVYDDKDKCRNTYGDPANQGCPRSYFFTKNELEGFIGLQLNSAKINLPELNQLGYSDQSGNGMDVLQSKKGALKNPGALTGIHAGANFTYFFGQKRKRSGISVGFTYSGFTAEYLLTDPIVYTFKSSDGTNFYRRQITIDTLKERINYTILNFPVMFNYRFHPGKSVICLKAGPSLMLFNNTSNYDAVIDFAGLYQIDTIKKNAVTYYDHFDEGSKYNIFFSSSGINSQSPVPGADNVFEQLRSKNYDFAHNKKYAGKSNNLTRLTAALNLGVDLQQKISQGLILKAGAYFVYAPLLERKQKYKPVDKTSDEYQSIYNSNAKSTYSASGITVGIVYNF